MFEKKRIFIDEFGFQFSMKYYFYKNMRLRKHYLNLISNYLEENYWDNINIGLKNKEEREEIIKKENYKIWVFWWQGKENMPPVVDLCFNNLKKRADGIEVILIDKFNFYKYVNLPDFILDKFNLGKFTITHFSDIIRFYLLYNYGGLWIDATVFVEQNLLNYKLLFEYPFFTIKRKEEKKSFFISKSRWTGYLMGTNILHNKVLGCGLMLFYKYWKEHNVLIEYFLIDFFIDILYKNTILKKYIESLPFNNKDVEKLALLLNQKYNESLYFNMKKETLFYKLNWKIDIDYNREGTFYRKLKEV